jgi:uncharacterized membrane protein
MENRSTHYGDVSNWIEKIIDSCETYQQTFTVKNLVRNFRNKLMKDAPDKYWNTYQYGVIWPLEESIENKRRELLK